MRLALWDAQRERKKPRHVQGHVNKTAKFWKGAQSNYLSFVGSGQVNQIRSRGTIQCAGKMNTLREHKRRVQLIVKLKAIENAMGFSLLLFFQPPLLISDLLTDQEVIRSKEVTLSGGNELADLVGSSPVGLRVVAFEEVS